MEAQTQKLLENMLSQDKRALARLMTYVDNRHPDLLELMGQVYEKSGKAFRLGVTGPPGAGKSTLVDKLIGQFRSQGKTVGVVAIDPSSPFSGGAVLGDRIRMQDHNGDDGVFIRSLGSRGAHGGLSRATRDIVQLLDAFGSDVVIIETVGVGQTELDIMSVAYTTMVVLVPESGDTVQTMKAGLMEIADLFVVNKSDREGADRMTAELQALSDMYSADWDVPVLQTTALHNKGLDQVIQTIEKHHNYVLGRGHDDSMAAKALQHETIEILLSELGEVLLQKMDQEFAGLMADVKSQKINPYRAAGQVLKLLKIGT